MPRLAYILLEHVMSTLCLCLLGHVSNKNIIQQVMVYKASQKQLFGVKVVLQVLAQTMVVTLCPIGLQKVNVV